MPITKKDKDRAARLLLEAVDEPHTLALTKISETSEAKGTPNEILVQIYQSEDLITYRLEIYPDKYLDPTTKRLVDTNWEGKEPVWFRDPKGFKRIYSDVAKSVTPLDKNCPKCRSLLNEFGQCLLCDRQLRAAERKSKIPSDPNREEKIKGAVAPRSFPVDRRVVTAHASKKLKAYGAKDVPIDSVDVPLLKILKDVRRKFVPAILVRGEDPFEHYDFDSLAQGSELVWNLLILWSEAWQLEGVAEALDYISPEQELMILDGIDNVHFKDTDELINTYADLILEFRQAQIDQNAERPEALYEQRAPVRLPPRVVEEKVKWRGIPTLMFREVICPHCGFVNKDHGIIDPKTKLPKPMECAMCGKSFRVEDAEKGIWRRAHKGYGPAKKLPIPGAPGSIPGSTPSLKKLFREIREMKDAEKTRGKIKTKSQKRRERRSRLKK